VKRRRRFLDYYRQFEELSPEEVARSYRERSEASRSAALAVVHPLDLSSTGWHEPPHAEIVNAATFALRRSLNAYPDPTAEPARRALAEHHGLPAERIVLGHGAGELLAAALTAALRDGGEAILPWPTWPPLAALIARAGGTPVPVPLNGDAIDLPALDAAVRTGTRAIVLASPNDPTGLALGQDELAAFLRGLPERVLVVVDEALADFLPAPATALPLLAVHPRLVVVRSLSKAHALAGARLGWAAGGEGTGELLATLAPSGAVGAPAQAALLAALEVGDRVLPLRRQAVADARVRLAALLEGSPVSFPAGGVTNFAWLRAEGHDSRALAAHLAGANIAVTPGAPYNDEHGVRAALRGPEAVDRLGAALASL
jgi:histidinol-phosphate/aromatic aminotransferase/cobyric acid decarboxylase-like protein